MKRSREDLKEEILNSKTYQKFKKIVNNLKEQFDPIKIEHEIKQLHANRPARNLRATKINPTVMAEAAAVEIANRSRLVEIRVNLVEVLIDLKKAINAIKKYFSSEFDVEGIKYKSDKQAYFSRYIRTAEEFQMDVDRLISACDHFVSDIDQAGYGTKLIAECLEMIYKKERTI